MDGPSPADDHWCTSPRIIGHITFTGSFACLSCDSPFGSVVHPGAWANRNRNGAECWTEVHKVAGIRWPCSVRQRLFQVSTLSGRRRLGRPGTRADSRHQQAPGFKDHCHCAAAVAVHWQAQLAANATPLSSRHGVAQCDGSKDPSQARRLHNCQQVRHQILG